MARYKRYAPPLSPPSSSAHYRANAPSSSALRQTDMKDKNCASSSSLSFSSSSAKETYNRSNNDRLASPSMPMSGHVKSIRSTIEKKATTTNTATVGIYEEEARKQQMMMMMMMMGEDEAIMLPRNSSSNKASIIEGRSRVGNNSMKWKKESIIISQRAEQEREEEDQQRSSREMQKIQTRSTPSSSSSSSLNPPQSLNHPRHRFIPNRDSPTWKSVQKISLDPNNNEMMLLSPKTSNEQQQLSPTLTVSSIAAVASTASSSGGDADKISTTTTVIGNDETEKVLLSPHPNQDIVLSVKRRIALAMNEIEKNDDDDVVKQHLSSRTSPPSSSPPTPSPSSTCSSMNWEVLERLLGGGSSMDDNNNGGGDDVFDGEGPGTVDGTKDAKSKIRLLAELVGSKVITTTSVQEVELYNDDKENSQGTHNAKKEKKKTTSKKKRGSSEAATQTQNKGQHDSLLGSFVDRNDKMTMTSSESIDIVIENTPSSVTTSSSKERSNTFHQRQYKKSNISSNSVSNTNIAVDIATSFSSASSYSSSSLVYSLGDTVQSVEHHHHRGHPLPQRILNHPPSDNDALVAVTDDNIAVATLDESTMHSQVVRTSSKQPTVHQQKDCIRIDHPVLLTYNVNSTNTNDDSDNKNDATVEKDPVADVFASTLAECRLLLEMSPPPTPMTYRQGKQHKFPTMDEKQEVEEANTAQKVEELPQLFATSTLLASAHLLVQSLKSQTQQQSENEEENVGDDVNKDEEANDNNGEQEQEEGYAEENEEMEEGERVEVEIQEVAQVAAEDEERPLTHENEVIGDVSSLSKASYRYPTSFSEFLTCPSCSEEFTAEDEGAHQPLHSFACDHIICRGCVYNAFSHAGEGGNSISLSTMVFCPECGQDGAFDVYRPIVSRAYLNLVRKMKSTGRSISSKDGVCSHSNGGEIDLTSQPNYERWHQSHDQPVGTGKSVPSQICVPPPTSKKNRENNSHRIDKNPAKSDEKHHKRDAATLTVIVSTNNSTHIDSNDATTVSDHPQQLHQDPNTPISRAQFHVVQRREKLAQSLEKVNMILERSMALTVPETPKEEEFMAFSNDFSSNLIDDEDSKSKAFEWDKNVFHTVTSGIKSRCKSELRIDTGEDAFLSSSWSSPPSFGQVEVAERNAAEVYGNNLTANEPHVLTDRLLTFPPDQSQVLAILEGGNDTFDIFRAVEIDLVDDTNNPAKSDLIEFGCASNYLFSLSSFSDSSATESKSDTLSLLAENRLLKPSSVDEQCRKVLKSSKFKAYCFNNVIKNGASSASANTADGDAADESSTTLDNGSDGDEKEHERSCPQFLPSLKYSIMDESDELAGLVEAETPCGVTTKPFVILSNSMPGSGTKGKRRMQKGKFGSSGGGSSSSGSNSNSSIAGPEPFQPLVSCSFDNEFFHQMGDSGSIHNNTVLQEVMESGDENQVSANNPTYDFSMHSCSLSPSTHAADDGNDDVYYDDSPQVQLNGRSLVTHKPRMLHKKLLKTLRVVGSSGVKKSRKPQRARIGR